MQIKILVIDDEEVILRSCERILDGREWDVEAESDGLEALKKIEHCCYDLVILDIMMPRISGLDLLQQI